MLNPRVFNVGVLVGFQLRIAGYACDMRTFVFGNGETEWALHVQCPWRLERDGRIITGRSDWRVFESDSDPGEDWDPAHGGSLQQARLGEVLGDPDGKPLHNRTENFVVEVAGANDLGDVELRMSGGYKLVIFPAGLSEEDWRLFRRHDLSSHLVWPQQQAGATGPGRHQAAHPDHSTHS